MFVKQIGNFQGTHPSHKMKISVQVIHRDILFTDMLTTLSCQIQY
jgi:hypothetical protein